MNEREKLAEARKLLAKFVKDIDAWNAEIQKIIGTFPNYYWGVLEEARTFLALDAAPEKADYHDPHAPYAECTNQCNHPDPAPREVEKCKTCGGQESWACRSLDCSCGGRVYCNDCGDERTGQAPGRGEGR